MGVRLPAEYQEVEWIETNGYQRIKTDAHITSNNVCIDYKLTNVRAPSMSPFLLACGGANRYFIPLAMYSSQTDYRWFSSYNDTRDEWESIAAKSSYGPDMIRTEFDFASHKRIGYVNGVKTVESSFNTDIVSAIGNSCNLWLFTWMTSPNSFDNLNRGSWRFYSLVYKEDGVEKLNLVPCVRKSDSKPGIYNLVTGAFFVNEATGSDFLVGPDVIDSISPWLVARRRMLMRKYPELYPIGTDVVSMYAANWVDDSSWQNTGGNSGISGASRCTDFIPINPKYTYRKNGHRLYNYCCWYDKDMHFIGSFSYNNTTVQDIANIPENARYMRISTYKSSKENLKIIRTA